MEPNTGLSLGEIWAMIIGSGGLLTLIGGIVFLSFRTGKIIAKMDERFTQIDKRLEGVEKKVDNLCERVARIEGAMWRNGTGG